MRKLYLDRVGISDLMAISIINLTESSETLRCLSLSENKLSDQIADSVTRLVTNNQTLEELYLAWNNLTSVGGEPIFRALGKNKTLRVLDLGWNGFGTNLKVEKRNANSFVDSVSIALKENTCLVHLSLSNNGFSFDESKKIAEGLNQNKTMYGFHFSGNFGYIDYLGIRQVTQAI